MVLLQLRPFLTPELHNRVARIPLVLGADDVGLILLHQEAELDQLGIRQEVQRDQIGARLFQRRKLLFERRLRIALQLLVNFAGGMPDHLVHVRRQLAGQCAPLGASLRFLGRP